MKPTLMPRRKATSVSAGSTSGSPSGTGVPTPASTTSTSSSSSTVTMSSGAIPVSKFSACYQAILQGTEKPQPYSKQDPERFYSDLFCLRVDSNALKGLSDAVKDEQLADSGTVKNNVRELFFFAVQCLKTTTDDDDPRTANVIETLHVILRSFLLRSLPNYSVTVMSLLAGSIDQADIVFPDLVAGIDSILSNPSFGVSLKERTLSLALLIVTSLDQGSINSYFLRRDLFSTVAKLVSEPATCHLTADGFLMLGILANYHKYEARNAMLVRFEDLVDETIMRRLRETAATSLQISRDAYVAKCDDSPPTLMSNVTSLVSSIRFLAGPLSPPLPRANSNGASSLATPREESIYSELPPELSAIMLPIYDLINSNKAFGSFLLHDRPDPGSPEPDFIATLASLSSYIATHAATTRRSQLYSRLVYAMLTILVEEGAQVFIPIESGRAVRICRQRQPTLAASNDVKRPVLCSILDSLVLYMRFNLVRRRFDVDTYLLVLRLAHKIMHQLKTVRTRLQYDWQPLHQALLSLAHFLVARQSDLSDLSGIEDLITQVLLTLDFSVVWADVILPNNEAYARFLYEILRAEDTLTKLGTLTTLANTPPIPPSPRLGPAHPSERRKSMTYPSPTNGSAPSSPTPKSPTLSTANSGFAAMLSPNLGSTEPTGPAADSVRNLGVVRSHFGGKVDDFKEKSGLHVVGTDQVMELIRSSMDGLDLRESMALEDGGMRRYSESDHESFFTELVSIVAKDILALSKS